MEWRLAILVIQEFQTLSLNDLDLVKMTFHRVDNEQLNHKYNYDILLN